MTVPSAPVPSVLVPPVLPPPRLMVLSYLGGTGSPTRVRNIACGALLALGILSVLGGLVLLALAMAEAWNVGPWGGAYAFRPGDFLIDPRLYSGGLLLVGGVPWLVFAPGVRRGQKVASIVSLILVWLALVFLVPVVALVASLGLLNSMDRQQTWLGPTLLASAGAGVFLSLLLLDLQSCLKWIARAPVVDMPPKKFV